MLIDWFTVSAQALNFLLLVWLLRRFLYKPILNAIDAREKLIAVELADASAKKIEAQKERDEFQHKNDEFDKQRTVLFSQATDAAKAERQRLFEEERKAADALRSKREQALQNDSKNLNAAIARRTQLEVFSIARKALKDLAATGLEEQIIDVFAQRLRELDAKPKATLGAALKTAEEPAVLRSAFELSSDERAKIQRAINETFLGDIHLRFETAPDQIAGVELNTNGQKVSWSIADYLTSLEKGVSELVNQHNSAEPKPTPKSDARPQQELKAKSESNPEVPAPAASPAKADPVARAESASKIGAGTMANPIPVGS